MSSAADIAKTLHGSRNGDGFLCRCPVPGHGKGRGDRSPSLSISDGKSSLLVHCFAGCDAREVFAELRRRGLLDDRPQEAATKPRRRPVAPAIHEPEAKALALWKGAERLPWTLAGQYLRARGIAIEALPSLRFLSDAEYLSGRVHLPAMVAAVQAPDRRIIAIQLTFIDPRGDRKAQVATPRRTIGALGYGAVRLGPAGEVLGLAEGVETGLSAMQIFRIPVWCSLGAGRLHTVAVPEAVRELHVFADDDDPGRAAAERAVIAHWHRKVIVHYPPLGCNDWNDALAQKASAA